MDIEVAIIKRSRWQKGIHCVQQARLFFLLFGKWRSISI